VNPVVPGREDIPAGGFVCVYSGELLRDSEAEGTKCDEYMFDLDTQQVPTHIPLNLPLWEGGKGISHPDREKPTQPPLGRWRLV